MSQFIVEARAGQFEFARVLADFTSAEENALQLSAGEIVAVVPKVQIWNQNCIRINIVESIELNKLLRANLLPNT